MFYTYAQIKFLKGSGRRAFKPILSRVEVPIFVLGQEGWMKFSGFVGDKTFAIVTSDNPAIGTAFSARIVLIYDGLVVETGATVLKVEKLKSKYLVYCSMLNVSPAISKTIAAWMGRMAVASRGFVNA